MKTFYKKVNKLKKIKISYFIGRQLSRLKFGQSYYSIVMSTLTALSLVSLAFPEVSIMFLIVIFPAILFGTFLIGLFLDKSNIISTDTIKTVEMTHRYLNVADFKNNDFRILMMKTMFEWMKSIQDNKPMNYDNLKEEYDKFLKKWNPPKE